VAVVGIHVGIAVGVGVGGGGGASWFFNFAIRLSKYFLAALR
jgi:hypothetical protein